MANLAQGEWYGAGATVVPAAGDRPRHVVAANELRCPVLVEVFDRYSNHLGGALLAPGAFVQLQASMVGAEYTAVSCVVPPPPPPVRAGLLRFVGPGTYRKERDGEVSGQTVGAAYAGAAPAA